jgi:hypothetical protein
MEIFLGKIRVSSEKKITIRPYIPYQATFSHMKMTNAVWRYQYEFRQAVRVLGERNYSATKNFTLFEFINGEM